MVSALRQELEDHSLQYRTKVSELNDAYQREEKMHQAETGQLRDIMDAARREHREELMSLDQKNRAEAKLLQDGNATLRDSLEQEHLRHQLDSLHI